MAGPRTINQALHKVLKAVRAFSTAYHDPPGSAPPTAHGCPATRLCALHAHEGRLTGQPWALNAH